MSGFYLEATSGLTRSGATVCTFRLAMETDLSVTINALREKVPKVERLVIDAAAPYFRTPSDECPYVDAGRTVIVRAPCSAMCKESTTAHPHQLSRARLAIFGGLQQAVGGCPHLRCSLNILFRYTNGE